MSLSRLLLRLVLGRRLPITSGELRVGGLAGPVTIRRDKWGVPHVDAGSDPDAWFGLGFCHAQDRGGQLEVLWRAGRGRLAEWVGPDGLGADRVSRRVGFWQSAAAQFPILGPAERQIIEAYVRGVNAGIAVGLPKPPHEFAVLGGRPSAWEPPDVLAVLKLQSFLIPSNWDVELARLRVLLADGPDAVRELDPVVSRDPKKIAPGSALPFGSRLTDTLAADLAALCRFLPRGGGSNNWAIAGSRTASGKPLLANDPHLAPTAPPPWYLAHLRTPDWEVAGATLAGTPGFPIGQNGFAAWGITAGFTDNTDLFVETLGPDGVSVREADGSFTRCEPLREVIRVKGRADVVEDVFVTPRGPVLTSAVTGLPLALSLRAVWLDLLPVSGFLTALRARSFEEFRNCFAAWPGMPLNLAYADAGGTIGWQLAGQLPERKGGNGLLPRPADDPDAGWAGYVPFDRMPFVANPECGFVATANDPPQGQGAWGEGQETAEPPASSSLVPRPTPLAPFLGNDFIDPYRAAVIRDELGRRLAWDVAGCGELQQSVRSIPWEEMRDVVLSLKPVDPAARDAIALLRDWDGRVDAESPAAAVFELFVAELCVRVARAKAPNGWLAVVGETGLGTDGHNTFCDRRVGHLVRLMRDQPAGWFTRSWADEMADVLGGVVRKLRREVGPGPGFWVWGNVRQLWLTHALFGKSRLLGPAFNLGPVPVGGDANTPLQAGCRPAAPTTFTHNIPNLRVVFDLADPGASTFVLCGGQSGNPCSPHHADQLPLWQAGETITVAWHQPRVIREAKEVLRLVPQPEVRAQKSEAREDRTARPGYS
jgi:penicillin amidase